MRSRPRRGSTRVPRRSAWRSKWRASRRSCMRHARRQAREVALQALYAWQLSGGDPLEEARANEAYEKSEFLDELLRGVAAKAPELERMIAPHLDREFRRLSP